MDGGRRQQAERLLTSLPRCAQHCVQVTDD